MKRLLVFFLAAAAFFTLDSYLPAGDAPAYPYTLKHVDLVSQKQTVFMVYMHEKAAKPNGKTVLLLHGKNFSGAYWGGVMKALLDKGYNVVAPDQVGFGQSSMPPAYQYSFQQLAANTKLLLDSIGVKKAIVLGHSMGGMLAVRFALMYPNETEQLILEDPIGLEDYKSKVPYTTVDENFRQELGKTKASVKEYMLTNYFHNEWKNDYDALLDASTHDIGAPAFEAHSWSMALTSDMIFTQPVCYEFGNLHVPTVLIIGQKDRTAIGKERAMPDVAARLGDYPALGKATTRKTANCILAEMPGVGHIPHIEAPDAFLKQLFKVMH